MLKSVKYSLNGPMSLILTHSLYFYLHKIKCNALFELMSLQRKTEWYCYTIDVVWPLLPIYNYCFNLMSSFSLTRQDILPSIKALQKTVFSEIFVFASFEIDVFRNFESGRVFRAFTELVPTRENSFRLENRLKSHKKSRFSELFVFASFGNNLLLKFPKITKKWRSTCPVSTRENSFRLENRLESLVKSSECRALPSMCFS